MLTLELQADLPVDMKQKVVGGLLWLAVFFAGALGLERSFADENDDGCWDALRMYPVSPAVVYIAKFLFNCHHAARVWPQYSFLLLAVIPRCAVAGSTRRRCYWWQCSPTWGWPRLAL